MVVQDEVIHMEWLDQSSAVRLFICKKCKADNTSATDLLPLPRVEALLIGMPVELPSKVLLFSNATGLYKDDEDCKILIEDLETIGTDMVGGVESWTVFSTLR